MLSAYLVNITEARQFLKQETGQFAPRHATISDIDEMLISPLSVSTNQEKVRTSTQKYVQANWQVLQEILSCKGDCASKDNVCTDAQATICYKTNRKAIEG